MTECDLCKGTGKRFVDEYSDFGLRVVEKVCYNCNGSGKVKSVIDKMAQTNEEWFGTLSTKEKVKRIINIVVNSDCDYETIVKWLKQPHIQEI